MDQPSPPSLDLAQRLRRATVVEVVYPTNRGPIGLRGSLAPLSWTETMLPTVSRGDRHIFELDVPEGETVDVKLVRGSDWANGRDHTIHAGDHLRLEPAFERKGGRLLEPGVIDAEPWPLRYDVRLPPSYDEQDGKRYPVLYVQDGQSLWEHSEDPFGVWSLDTTLDQLLELAVIDEFIVVGIHTAEARLDRLGPVPDPDYGGGQAERHLQVITEMLKPRIDAEFRTQPDAASTGIMGSSMGGLFSFYAAWTRPDVFGKAICLSSSFGWANRHMVRAVTSAKTPRPTIYLDSGAALSADESRPGAKDGFHDTRSMYRALIRVGHTDGRDLHRLTFPGHTHNAAAWAARVAMPLQLLFPPARLTQVPAAAIVASADAAA